VLTTGWLDASIKAVALITMPEDQIAAFLEAMKADEALRNRVQSADNPETVVVIAKEAGFVITPDDLERVEISDEQLAQVAGGWGRWPGSGI
jgi:predicted ribosomally synthesized peptide with nif11-like leader